MEEFEIEELEINDLPFGITDEEYQEIGDTNDAD